jgi:DNA invertase Pin-like site-specific DNA recombinase
MTKRSSARPTTGRAIGYVRVSTQRQDLSPTAQAERLRHRAAERGLTLDIYEERESAKNMTDRPVLDRAKAELAAGKADALLVTKLDRVARNLRDSLELDDLAQAQGRSLVILDLDFDSSNATGRLIRNVMAAIASWECEIIGERTTEALAAKRKLVGLWAAGLGRLTGRENGGDDVALGGLLDFEFLGGSFCLTVLLGFLVVVRRGDLSAIALPARSGGLRWPAVGEAAH